VVFLLVFSMSLVLLSWSIVVLGGGIVMHFSLWLLLMLNRSIVMFLMMFSGGIMVLNRSFVIFSLGLMVFFLVLVDVMTFSWGIMMFLMMFSGGIMVLGLSLLVLSGCVVMFCVCLMMVIIVLLVVGVLLHWLVINVNSFLLRLFLVSNCFFVIGRLSQYFLHILDSINVAGILFNFNLMMMGWLFVVRGLLMMGGLIIVMDRLLVLCGRLLKMNGLLFLLVHNDMFNNLSLHRLCELGAFDKLL